MLKSIKQKIARNWFKSLQDLICQDIEKIEKSKNKFKKKNGLEVQSRMKVEANIEY